MTHRRNQARASAARAKNELYEDLILGAAERSFASAKIQEIADEAGMREDLVPSFCRKAALRWLAEASEAVESVGEESADG